MPHSIAIRADQLSKVYPLYDRPSDRLKQMFFRGRRQYFREFAALQEVSFTLKKGEVLGLVGRNGAGKSTLLQMICNTLTPSAGTVTVNGRVAALLELGAGFNPDFTGRENIYLNASVLGLQQAEIDARYDDIVAFSGIGDFIHQPVKTYSSGMYVRLAFAIATSVDPDILVIDEALSVGDGAFARKSFDRIMQLKDKGVTILFCSHSMYQIEAICNKAIWLERGQVRALGNPGEVIVAYESSLESAAHTPPMDSTAPPPTAIPAGFARIRAVRVRCDGIEGKKLTAHSGSSTLSAQIDFASDPALPAPVVAVTLHAMDGQTVCSAGTHLGQPVDVTRDGYGEGHVEVTFPALPLLKGTYHLSAHLLCERGVHLYESATYASVIQVKQQDLSQGVFIIPAQWTMGTPSARPLPASTAAEDIGRTLPADADTLDLLAAHAPALPVGASLPLDIPAEAEALAARFGLARQAEGIWLKTRQPRWQLGWVRRDQQAAWLTLFEAAFGHSMTPAFWHWKYRDTDKLGVGAWRDGQLVAFYGGMPRPILETGNAAYAVQVGDVMVHPAERGVMTKSGVFQQIGTSFLESQIGYGCPHLLGFGFPNARALSTASKMGLYAGVDTLTEARWTVSRARPSPWHSSRPVTAADAPQVEALWQAMARDLRQNIVGVRDWAYLQARYLDHPDRPYTVLLTRHRWTRQPVGLVVLRDRGTEGIELVDVVAPLTQLPVLVQTARRFAAYAHRPSVFAWITSSQQAAFACHQATLTPMDIVIPTNIWSAGPAPETVQNRWWLMAGDTDFR